MIVQLDTCACVLGIDGKGEPSEAISLCPRHAAPAPANALAECRAKNVAVAASGLGADAVWGFADDGTAHVVEIDLASGTMTSLASSPPLTLEQYVAAVAAG